MAADIAPLLSLLSQRLVPSPGQVSPPSPIGRGTVVRRFREGFILEVQARAELASLGYAPPDVERALVLAELERQYDITFDRLAVVREAYAKDIISHEDLKALLLELVPDQVKALVLLDLYDFRKRPRPRAVATAQAPTLTVARLTAAFRAGLLAREDLAQELAERGYSPADVDILVATEEARLEPPTTAQARQLTLGDLRAMYDLGVISAADFARHLRDRGFGVEDVDALLALQEARQTARTAPPGPEAVRDLSVADLKAMYTLGIITEADLRGELLARGFRAEDVGRQVALIQERSRPRPAPPPTPDYLTPAGRLRVQEVREAFRAGALDDDQALATLQDQEARGLIPSAIRATQAYAALTALAMPPDEAQAWVSLEITRRTARAG